MTRTFGHKVSRHVYWKHQTSHSSNKKNKKDSHKSRRANIRKLFTKMNMLEIDINILP